MLAWHALSVAYSVDEQDDEHAVSQPRRCAQHKKGSARPFTASRARLAPRQETNSHGKCALRRGAVMWRESATSRPELARWQATNHQRTANKLKFGRGENLRSQIDHNDITTGSPRLQLCKLSKIKEKSKKVRRASLPSSYFRKRCFKHSALVAQDVCQKSLGEGKRKSVRASQLGRTR